MERESRSWVVVSSEEGPGIMKWCGNTLILSDHSLLTVRDGNLELRGEGWVRRKKGDTENTDLVRVCKFGDNTMARRIAKMVGKLVEA
jgi:hypothetical protein